METYEKYLTEDSWKRNPPPFKFKYIIVDLGINKKTSRYSVYKTAIGNKTPVGWKSKYSNWYDLGEITMGGFDDPADAKKWEPYIFVKAKNFHPVDGRIVSWKKEL